MMIYNAYDPVASLRAVVPSGWRTLSPPATPPPAAVRAQPPTEAPAPAPQRQSQPDVFSVAFAARVYAARERQVLAARARAIGDTGARPAFDGGIR
jgi:hypothetical protein